MGIADTFSAIFCQYSIPILLSASSAAAAAAQQQPRHVIADVCLRARSYALVHRARRRKLHAMDTRAGVRPDGRTGVKTLTTDSETFDLKPDHELHTVQLTLHALALRVIAHPILT